MYEPVSADGVYNVVIPDYIAAGDTGRVKKHGVDDVCVRQDTSNFTGSPISNNKTLGKLAKIFLNLVW